MNTKNTKEFYKAEGLAEKIRGQYYDYLSLYKSWSS